MAASLPSNKRREVLRDLPAAEPVADETGPTKTLLYNERFDEVHLLSN